MQYSVGMSPPLTLGDRLRGLRAERGLGQAEVVAALKAAGVELSQQTLSRWEKGVGQPRIGDLQSLADLYGIDVTELARLPVAQ
jgi:transcriptional regulator with XRE-family HTH domain